MANDRVETVEKMGVESTPRLCRRLSLPSVAATRMRLPSSKKF